MTNTSQSERPENATRRNLFPAFCSFLIPGAGQLLQGRGIPGFGFLLLFALTAAMPVFILHSIFDSSVFFLSGGDAGTLFIFVLLMLPFPVLALFFSVMDAAYRVPGEKTFFTKVIVKYIAAFVSVYIFLFIAAGVICSAPEAMMRMQCSNNLKQIGLAMWSYHDKYDSFPPEYTVDEEGNPLHSWRVLLLPYMDEDVLYQNINLDEPWNSEHNRQFHDLMPQIYSCRVDKRRGATALLKKRFPDLDLDAGCNYTVISGKEAPFDGPKCSKASDFLSGTSNTILVAERLLPVCWMDPGSEVKYEAAIKGVNKDLYGIGSAHGGGCNIVLADGWARFISETLLREYLEYYLQKSPPADRKPEELPL